MPVRGGGGSPGGGGGSGGSGGGGAPAGPGACVSPGGDMGADDTMRRMGRHRHRPASRRPRGATPSGTHGLARWISKLGAASRTQAARLVAEGRVSVDGLVARDPERRTDPRRETIAIDGRPLARRAPIHLVLHKPAGVITTASDERGRPTVYDFLPPLGSWVFPVGRLDADTTGLLLFTNDTRLAEALTNERSHVEKRYEVLAAGALDPADAARLARGVDIPTEGGRVYRTLPARCEILAREAGVTRLALTIREGKNRQVRKMLEAIGHPVLALARTRFGPLRLGDLAPGAVRPLAPEEVAALRAAVGPRRRPRP